MLEEPPAPDSQGSTRRRRLARGSTYIRSRLAGVTAATLCTGWARATLSFSPTPRPGRAGHLGMAVHHRQLRHQLVAPGYVVCAVLQDQEVGYRGHHVHRGGLAQGAVGAVVGAIMMWCASAMAAIFFI